MKTLKWILGILQVLAVGAIGKLLYDNFDTILLYFLAYPANVVLTTVALILVILVICSLEINFTRKINLRNSFEVSKSVKKLIPDDFHITNYIEFYINRESDKKIEDLLSQRKYIFITGIPMLGKTRMAYEATKKLNDYYLLKPKYETIDIEKLKLPLFKKKIVLFLDDIDKYVGKFSIDALIRKIKEKAKDFVVITTCRSGKEFERVFAKKDMENVLTQCQRSKIEPRLLEIEEERNLATQAGKDLNQIASDGTPGSITIDLRYMKERYEHLGDGKSILKCLKLLREGNISLWTEGLVKETSRKIFGLNTERTKWDDYIKSLKTSSFIKQLSELIFITHDIYLDDRFLEEFIVKDAELILLKEKLFEFKDSMNLLNLGISFYRRTNRDEALACYQESIRIKPDFIEPHYNMGIIFEELKRYEEAEKEYKEALRINPDYIIAHNNLGLLLRELQRYSEAEKEYKEALRIKPDYAYAHGNLGNLFSALKRYAEAGKEYREALRINPDDVIGHNNLGLLLYELKRYEEAEKEYKEALRINPDYLEAHNNLGLLLYELKRHEEAEKEYKEALRINPDYPEAHNNLGLLLDELKRYAEAEKEYREALRINPDFSVAHYNLGILLDDLKRLAEAEKEYKEALRINPEYTEAHGNLGILLGVLNRKDEAKREFEIARDLFRKQGREDDAKKAEGLLEGL